MRRVVPPQAYKRERLSAHVPEMSPDRCDIAVVDDGDFLPEVFGPATLLFPCRETLSKNDLAAVPPPLLHTTLNNYDKHIPSHPSSLPGNPAGISKKYSAR
uniref:Uncharacterized protein n=1 Tax=Vespula pensylvanica TaxID=30213 RepID=A0A834P744_VESPE|nr:hypothetical protein H0235_004323 [Vespula pensylvanica]